MEESNAKISSTPVRSSADQREGSHRWQWDPSSSELAGWLNDACSSGQDRLSADVIDSVERSLYTRGYRYCEPMVPISPPTARHGWTAIYVDGLGLPWGLTSL